MVELVNVTDPNLPEPKGVASASNGDVYVADGEASGTWTQLGTGWGFYQDGTDNEQSFSNATNNRLTIDGTGSDTEENYLPLNIRGSDSLWDTANSFIDPISTGDAFVCTLHCPVTERTTAEYLDLILDIGGNAGSITNEYMRVRQQVNQTAPFTISYTFSFPTLATFVNNGGRIFMQCNAGSVGITNPSLFISVLHSGDF